MLPDLVNIVVNRLKILLWLDLTFQLHNRPLDFVNQILQNLIAVKMKQRLQKHVLVIKVIQLNDERVDLLDLVHDVQVLLGLYSVQDPLGLLA